MCGRRVYNNRLFNRHGCAACGDHEHGSLSANCLIVDVDSNDCIGAKLGGLLFHLLEGDRAGFSKLLFIRSGSAAHDVTDAGKEVFEEIRTEDGFARDDAVIFSDSSALDAWGS
jgi:hypothetical protein